MPLPSSQNPLVTKTLEPASRQGEIWHFIDTGDPVPPVDGSRKHRATPHHQLQACNDALPGLSASLVPADHDCNAAALGIEGLLLLPVMVVTREH